MNEQHLLRVCISISLLGLCVLLLYSGELNLEPISHEQLQTTADDATVNIQGTVLEVSQQDTVAFLTIANQKIEETPVVVFKDQDIYIHEGDYIELSGTVETYKGEKEIIASSITIQGR